MIIWISEIPLKIHWSPLVDHPVTSQFSQKQTPICEEQEVQQGFWVTKDSSHLCGNPEDNECVKHLCSQMCLLVIFNWGLIDSMFQEAYWKATSCIPFLITDLEQTELWDLWPGTVGNCCTFQSMEKLLGRQSKQIQIHSLYQLLESRVLWQQINWPDRKLNGQEP